LKPVRSERIWVNPEVARMLRVKASWLGKKQCDLKIKDLFENNDFLNNFERKEIEKKKDWKFL
jgi:hypothetical protein